MGKQHLASPLLPRNSEMRLDNRTIGKLTRPPGKADHIEWDDDLAGFGFRLRAADHGRKTRRSWIAQYRAKGRTRRLLIGSAETLTAEQARAQARKILAQVALGNDPPSRQEGGPAQRGAHAAPRRRRLSRSPEGRVAASVVSCHRAVPDWRGLFRAIAHRRHRRNHPRRHCRTLANNRARQRHGDGVARQIRLVHLVRLGDGRGVCGSQPDNRDQSASRSDAARPGAIRCGNCGDLDRSRRWRLWENRAAVVVDRGAPARNRRC
jgi:hypothetical protein